MNGFDPLGCFLLFFGLLLTSFVSGGKTSAEDEDIDDYWSDG